MTVAEIAGFSAFCTESAVEEIRIATEAIECSYQLAVFSLCIVYSIVVFCYYFYNDLFILTILNKYGSLIPQGRLSPT